MPKRINDTEKRKKQILAAAGELFGRKGYHGTSLDEIAKACNIVRGTVLRYFGSKKELYKCVLYDRKNLPADYLIKICDDTTVPAREAVNQVLALTVEQFQNTLEYVGKELTYEEDMQNFDVIRLPVFRKLREYLEKIMIRGNEAGEFNIENPRMRSYSLTFAVFGVGESLADIADMEKELYALAERLLK